jgi:hypothetical protein
MHAGSVANGGKRQLERTGCRWDGNIKMTLKEIAWGS